MKIKRIISVFVILAMLLSFAACQTKSDKDKDDDEDETESINNDFEGKYEGEVDLVNVMVLYLNNEDEIEAVIDELGGKSFIKAVFDIRETTLDITFSGKTSEIEKYLREFYDTYAYIHFDTEEKAESALEDIDDEAIERLIDRVKGTLEDLSSENIVYELNENDTIIAEFPDETIEFELGKGKKKFTVEYSTVDFYNNLLKDVEFKKTANMEKSDNSLGSENSNTSNDTSNDSNNNDNSDYSDDIPDDIPNDKTELTGDWKGFTNELMNFGGKTINILGYIGEFQYDSCQVSVEYATGDPVVDALYKRNQQIYNDLGLKIVRITPEDNDDMISKFRNAVTTGTNDYQALVAPFYYCSSFITEGLLYDIKGLNNPYLHLDQVWWDQNIMSDITLNDKVYFITGDALISDDESAYGILFNKDMIADNGAISGYIMEQTNNGNIYDLVKQGKWTLDAMNDMIQMVVNPTTDYALDDTTENIWGMVGQGADFMMLMEGMEQKMVVKGTDTYGREVPVLRIAEDSNVSAFMSLCNVFYDEDHVAITEHYAVAMTEKREVFASGKALFMPDQIAYIGKEVIKNSEVNYGLLPMPKRDASQSDYATSVQVFHCAVISIPVTCVGKDLDATCYALEAMAFLGNKLVKPEYYERTLKRKNLTDDESAQMLDLIFENKKYDMGAVFNFNAGDSGRGTIFFYPTILYVRGNTNVLSTYDKLSVIFQYGIDAFVNRCYGSN